MDFSDSKILFQIILSSQAVDPLPIVDVIETILYFFQCSGLVYRGAIMPSRKQFWKGEIVCGAMWFWILWRFYHDPEEVLGHNPWPDASKWTDEELGIPPDDED